MSKKDNGGVEDGNDSQEHQEEQNKKRQDLCVVISSEREMRSHEQIRIKVSQFTGICIRVKHMSPLQMNNLLTAIEVDAENFREQAAAALQAGLKPVEPEPITGMTGLPTTATVQGQTP